MAVTVKGISKYGVHALGVRESIDYPADSARAAEVIRRSVYNFAQPREWNFTVKFLPGEGIARITRLF